jgi:hypothetical protein
MSGRSVAVAKLIKRELAALFANLMTAGRHDLGAMVRTVAHTPPPAPDHFYLHISPDDPPMAVLRPDGHAVALRSTGDVLADATGDTARRLTRTTYAPCTPTTVRCSGKWLRRRRGRSGPRRRSRPG